MINVDGHPAYARAISDLKESGKLAVRPSTPGDWRKAMYYRYWMHNDNDHHVPAHYGIRTDR